MALIHEARPETPHEANPHSRNTYFLDGPRRRKKKQIKQFLELFAEGENVGKRTKILTHVPGFHVSRTSKTVWVGSENASGQNMLELLVFLLPASRIRSIGAYQRIAQA